MKSQIKLSTAELESGVIDSSKLEKSTELFETHGALWVENAMPVDMVHELAKSYEQTYSSLPVSALKNQHSLVGDHRFMITVSVQSPFNSPDLYANDLLMPFVERTLGQDTVISSFGSVVTFAGADDQSIHFDHPPLFESESVCAKLPCYAMTMVVPLVDLDEEIGSTAIWEGSHNSATARQQLHELIANPTWEGSTFPRAKVGDVYFMDYRVIHGGMANQSDSTRPILYIVYARPWFRDSFNFRDQPAVSISKDEYRKVPKQHRRLFNAAVT